MPGARRTVNEKVEHVHLFVQSHWDVSERVCGCGKIQISEEEMDRRNTVWDRYYKEVESTPSYVDFQMMRQAYKDRDLPAIREIMVRVKERQEKQDYLPKPKFPDPIGQSWRYELA